MKNILKKSDDHTRLESIDTPKYWKSLQKLKEKIEAIKSTVENPFEMFLPFEFRSSGKCEMLKWNLIKSEEVKAKPFVLEKNTSLVSKEEDMSAKNPNFNMIPLKQQSKQEKFKNNDKKYTKNKVLKNVDFTEAIVEYNKSKVEKVYALGSKDLENEEIQSIDVDAQQQQLQALIADKISSNLKSLSESVKCATLKDDAKTSKPFVYDPQSMDQLFAKPASKKNEYDPSSKIKRVQFSKVNKRRSTNAVTRNKQNQSLTFKKENNWMSIQV